MSFLNSIECKTLIKESDHESYSLEVWLYEEMERDLKIKIWKPKSILKNSLVKEIWLNEARQLNKLKSVTSADKYLEIIHDSFIDEGNYCLTYLSDESLFSIPDFLLMQEPKKKSNRLSIKSNYHWLHPKQIQKPLSRILLWKNILRLIEGIEILHRQGILHRNINIDSILYDASEEKGDDERFILSGFEKSLDFNKLSSASIIEENENIIFTSHQDWQDLARLIKELLNLDTSGNDLSLSTFEVNAIQNLEEGVSQREMLGGLVNINKIKDDLNRLITRLSDAENFISSKLFITTYNVNSNSFKRISEKISISHKEDSLTNRDIKKIIEEDLDIDSIKVFHDDKKNYLLKGKKYLYRFSKNNSESSSWYVSYINDIYIEIPQWLNYKDSIVVNSNLCFVNNASDISISEYIDENSWEIKLLKLQKEAIFSEKQVNCFQGFLMSLALDISLIEKDNHFITIKKVEEELRKEYINVFVDDGSYYYIFQYQDKHNTENKKLSDALKLRNPFVRLNRQLNEEDIHKWIIEPDKDIKEIQSHERKQVSFIAFVDGQLVFSSASRLEIELPNFYNAVFKLYSAKSHGQKAVIDRKVKTFNSLLSNASLALSLSEPQKNYHVSSRKFDVNNIVNEFDDSKKEIFEALIKTQPNYFIEGCPGVGKTYLITNYIKHIFEEENSAKVLLSAQAHATVRTLHKNTIKNIRQLEFFNDLIIIEDFKDEANIDKDNIIHTTTKPYIDKFKESELFKSNTSDIKIKEKINNFIERPDRSFFNQILRSANLIFTTSNSSLMSSLVQDDISFDVSVMEESAKASGLELLAPMLTSNKRVLIGDYKQLPPFSEPQVNAIINNYHDVDIHVILEQLDKVRIKNSILNELDVKNKTIDDDLKIQLLQNMKKYFSLFRSSCEVAESIRNRGQESFGGMLNIQHRMHPTIAQIVSTTVYDEKLTTFPEKKQYFERNTPFFFHNSSIKGLNTNNAVIWVDLPDKQSHKEMLQYEENYVNNKEIQIIQELLSTIKTNSDKAYSLKILSPYSKQVNMLNKQINKSKIHACFSESLKQNLASTVDSFQGNEADVIVISLVRHNSYADIGSALGFISDMRRMNVLLSRAKYKMIIVGCFHLFRKWYALESKERDHQRTYLSSDNFDFLQKFVQLLQADYEVMLDSTPLNKKTFSYVNFVSANKYLGIES